MRVGILLLTTPFLGSAVHAAITVQYPLAHSATAMTPSSLAPGAEFTGSPAYDPTTLNPPDLPDPLPATSYGVQMDASVPMGASIPHNGLFFGLSIEMSVTNQILSRNGHPSIMNVPFLNLCNNLIMRGGQLNIRIGGNTQENAFLVEDAFVLDGDKFMSKDYSNTMGTTNTPPIQYTDALFYLMNNISSLVNTKWFMGIPFNDTNYRMGIVTHGHRILGDNLLGLQAGNEPDFYPGRRRPEEYAPNDYVSELQDLVNLMQDSAYDGTRNILIAPSIAQNWPLNEMWETGIMDTFREQIKYMTVERYPTDNCHAQFGTGTERSAQDMYPIFMRHQHVVDLVAQFFDSAMYAQEVEKPFIMFETNTASCGGFPGLSNSFGGALWVLDYGLQMAHGNFSQAMLHVGGQSVYYNPFTAPPTNMSTFYQWSVGPPYYAMLAMAEAIGRDGNAQVLDITNYEANSYAPVYGIWENGAPSKVAIINYLNDQSRANDFTAEISFNGATVPSEVRVRRLSSETLQQLNGFTWAGQTFGKNFESDGVPMGEEVTETISCDTAANVCRITVPAPGFALVFLTEDALNNAVATATQTFSTTQLDRTINTATVDAAVLATSNGSKGLGKRLGSTSHGSMNGVERTTAVGMTAVVVGLASFVVVVRPWLLSGGAR